MDRKPFKDTKLWMFLADKAPKALDAIGDILPDKGVLGVVKNIIDKDPEIPTADKLEFEKLLIEHDREMYALEVKDRGSAREMQAEALRQNDVFSKRFVYYFSAFWSMSSALYIAGITFLDVPEANIRVVDTITGFLLGTVLSLMFSYFFGASLPKEIMRFQGKK